MILPANRRAVLTGLAASLVRPAPATAEPSRIALTAAPARQRLLPMPSGEAEVLAYSGASPGPVLRGTRGETLNLKLDNRAGAATSFHVGGWRGANDLDGTAGLTGEALADGASRDLDLLLPDPGIFTYGPLVPASAAEQAGRGLGGVLIVTGPGEPVADAELLLTVRDWLLTPGGALQGGFDAAAPRVRAGRLGNSVTVDGRPGPTRETFRAGARLRLRLASLCTARILPMRITGGTTTILGVAGHVAEPFVPLGGEMTVVPGGRYDLLLDLPVEGGREVRVSLALGGGIDLALFRTEGASLPSRGVAPSLPPANLPERIDLGRAERRSFRFEAPAPEALAGLDPGRLWRINGSPGGFRREPAFSVRRGAPVVLAFENRAAVPILMRVHGHALRILHPRDDGWEPYWLDAILVPPGGTERCAFVASNPGRWALRSGNLDHLAGGLFTWFEVT